MNLSIDEDYKWLNYFDVSLENSVTLLWNII
jgi:hypothetical protein